MQLYETIGHTIADPSRRQDCTAVYQTVEYNLRAKRIRVEHMTRWQGSRYLTWYFTGQTRDDAVALLEQIKQEGVEVLGEPDRKSAPIR
jgi:hypothetical protein